MHCLDHPALEPFGPSARRGNQPVGILHLRQGGAEHHICGADLIGMDERLAVKTKFMALAALRHQAVRIIQPVVNPVEHSLARKARGHHDHLQGGRQPRPSHAFWNAQVASQVIRPDKQPRRPCRSGNRIGFDQALYRLDHRDDGPSAFTIDPLCLRRAFHLGQYQIIRRSTGKGRNILLMQARPSHIDPDGHQLVSKPFIDGRHRRAPGTRLQRIGDGILKVEYDHIAGKPPRLFDRPRIGGGEKQERTRIFKLHGGHMSDSALLPAL